MPITNKLKILGDDDKIDNDNNLENILLDLENVLSNKNSVINNEIKNNVSMSIIESISDTKQHIWIDNDNYRILRINYFNKYGRVIKEVKFSNFNTLDGISMPRVVNIKDKKKKINYIANINNFQLVTSFDNNFFQPKGK